MEDDKPYSKLTYDMLDDLLKEVTFSKEDIKEAKRVLNLVDDGIPWRDQIKAGYVYLISGPYILYTGSTHATDFGKLLEYFGLSNVEIKDSITVNGLTLNEVKWIPINKDNRE